MPVNYESTAVNGQLVNVAPMQAFNPVIWGQSLAGPDFWPRNGPYNVPPVVPSPLASPGGSGNAMRAGGNPVIGILSIAVLVLVIAAVLNVKEWRK